MMREERWEVDSIDTVATSDEDYAIDKSLQFNMAPSVL
jgi:hypothetical protein